MGDDDGTGRRERGFGAQGAAEHAVGLAEGFVEDDGVGLVVPDALQRFVLIARGDDAVAGAEEGGFDVAQLAGLAAGEHDERLRMQVCGFRSHFVMRLSV